MDPSHEAVRQVVEHAYEEVTEVFEMVELQVKVSADVSAFLVEV